MKTSTLLRTSLLAAALGAALSAQALTLTLENPIVQAYAPATGTQTFALRGTVALAANESLVGGGASSAFDANGNSVTISPNFSLNGTLNSVRTFTGDLAYLTVQSTDPNGLYFTDSTGQNASTISFFAQTTSGTFVNAIASYQVNVAPVPEPASMVVLGLGALGLLRRRERS